MSGRRRAAFPGMVVALMLVAACTGSGTPSTTTEDGGTTTTQQVTTTLRQTTTTLGETTTTEPPETTTTTSAVTDEAEGSGCTPGPGALPDGTWYGYVVSSSATTIEFDLACWFTGDAAARAAAEDGEESPPPNDYYVRNANETTRALSVAEDAEVDWFPDFGDPTTEDTIDYLDWLAALPDRGLIPGIWVEVDGGEVTQISEQWVP